MRLRSSHEQAFAHPTTRGGPFVGRGAEVDRIRRALHRGDTPIVVLTGAAGIGKTQLARVLANETAERLPTFWTQADPAGQEVPFGIFEQWASGSTPDPLLRFSELYRVFADAAPHCLLVVDDANHADELSLFLLHQIATEGRVRLLLTLRSGELVPATLAEILAIDRVERIELPTLTVAEAGDLLSGNTARPVDDAHVQRLWERTGGNPLFLTALAAADDPGHLPTDLTAAVESLLHRFDREGLRPLIDLLAEIEALPLSALTRLIEAAVVETAEQRELISITPGGDWTVRLAHPLYGEVRRADQTAHDRRILRGTVVRTLGDDPRVVTDFASTIRMALLALDCGAAENRDRVLLRGAGAALSVLNTDLAVTLSEQIGTGPLKAQAKVVHGYALAAFGDGAGAEDAFTAAAQTSADPALLETIALMRANGAFWAGNDPEPLTRLSTDAAMSPETRTAMGAFVAALAGDPRHALTLQRHDPVGSDSAGQIAPHSFNSLMAAAARIVALGEVGDPTALTGAVEAGFRLFPGSVLAASQQAMLGTSMVFALATCGEVAATQAVTDRLVAQLNTFPGISQHWLAGLRSACALASGHVTAAAAQSRAALDGFASVGAPGFMWHPFALVCAEASAQAGDRRTTRLLIRRLADSAHCGFDHLESRRLLLDAWCAALRDQPAEILQARQGAVAAAELARTRAQSALEVHCLWTAVRFGADAADRLAALAAELPGLPRAQLAAQHAQQWVAGDAGALLGTADRYRNAGDIAACVDTLAQAATCQAQGGHRCEAVQTLQRAHELALTVGLDTPALRTADRASGLTGRQRDIVSMAHRGASNREIAQALSLSARTVEGHLYRASQIIGGSIRRGP
ncbi:MAG: AAA family ATPase [Gordonia sp. (in: high G+C Gram-positive bacteria)]|uniref:helix-turn-helix transcriptional regulator n=1 Tax=Gordonia sp. (in: high G+C Gram-positive bacteria) TaxID=84139 RepID=UPI003BB58C83